MREMKFRTSAFRREARSVAMTVGPGRSFPLGATIVDGGVNFCVYSGRAKRVELLLFDGAADAEPAHVHPTRRAHPPNIPLLARVRARPPPWAGLRVPGGGALRPRARTAVSIQRRSFSIPTRAPSWCRTATIAARRAARATTLPGQCEAWSWIPAPTTGRVTPRSGGPSPAR